MTSRSVPELRGIARRSPGVLAAALVIAGCAAPALYQSQAPSDTEAASPSASASASVTSSPRCPDSEPDLAFLISMTGWERLACFGDRPMTVVGTYGCGGCGGTEPGIYEPSWLAAPVHIDFLWVDWRIGAPLDLHIAPDSGLAFPPEGSIVRMTGHFNDPAAATCIFTGADGNPETIEEGCREAFVVDGYQITGTDPDFSPGG